MLEVRDFNITLLEGEQNLANLYEFPDVTLSPLESFKDSDPPTSTRVRPEPPTSPMSGCYLFILQKRKICQLQQGLSVMALHSASAGAIPHGYLGPAYGLRQSDGH